MGRKRPGWVFAAGITFVVLSVWYTALNYHPRPPGHQPVDGLGLFAMVLIVPAATIGGLLVFLDGESMLDRRLGPVAATAGVFVCCSAAFSLPVVYLLFFSDPHVSSSFDSYVESYRLSVVFAVSLGAVRLGSAIVSRVSS